MLFPLPTIHTHTHTHTRTHTNTCIHVYIHVCTCMYMYMYACCIHIHTHTHTHTHTGTHRGAGGYWRKYDATQLATPEAFEANPSLVWEFYSHRREVASTKVCGTCTLCVYPSTHIFLLTHIMIHVRGGWTCVIKRHQYVTCTNM